METWWNLIVEIVVPFDTREDAARASRAFDFEKLGDLVHEQFGGCREIMGTRIEEMRDEE